MLPFDRGAADEEVERLAEVAQPAVSASRSDRMRAGVRGGAVERTQRRESSVRAVSTAACRYPGVSPRPGHRGDPSPADPLGHGPPARGPRRPIRRRLSRPGARSPRAGPGTPRPGGPGVHARRRGDELEPGAASAAASTPQTTFQPGTSTPGAEYSFKMAAAVGSYKLFVTVRPSATTQEAIEEEGPPRRLPRAGRPRPPPAPPPPRTRAG